MGLARGGDRSKILMHREVVLALAIGLLTAAVIVPAWLACTGSRPTLWEYRVIKI